MPDRYETVIRDLAEAVLCAVICNAGPNGEPIACGYKPGHDGPHSWSTLPTWPMPDDPDYSPAYQDEYQRLWHKAVAEKGEAVEQERRRIEAELTADGFPVFNQHLHYTATVGMWRMWADRDVLRVVGNDA